MKYLLTVKRISEHKNIKKPNFSKVEDSTLSTVSLTDEDDKELFKCFCCENIGPSTDTPKQDRRIIAREYYLEWTDSSKNGSLSKKYPKWKKSNGRNVAIWIKTKDLESFANRRILIDVGNYPQDTEGCLLFGNIKADGFVQDSISAIHNFFEIVEKIGIENITLRVEEI